MKTFLTTTDSTAIVIIRIKMFYCKECMNDKLVNGHKRGKYNNNKCSLYENSAQWNSYK